MKLIKTGSFFSVLEVTFFYMKLFLKSTVNSVLIFWGGGGILHVFSLILAEN